MLYRSSTRGFRLARVAALLGRVLMPDDERDDAAPVIVIGYDAWRSTFAGDRTEVGREVWIGDAVNTIVGVMPERLAFSNKPSVLDAGRAFESRDGRETAP